MDTISFASGSLSGSVFPASGEVILDNAQRRLPAFFAVAAYSLNSKSAGRIQLRVNSNSGPALSVNGGSGIVGSVYGCAGVDKSQCLYVPASQYPFGAASVTLTAFLYDTSGNLLAQSAGVAYPIVKPQIGLALGGISASGAFEPVNPAAIEGGRVLSDFIPDAAFQISYNYPGPEADISIAAFSDTQQQIGEAGPVHIPVHIQGGGAPGKFPVSADSLGAMPTDGSGVSFVATLTSGAGQSISSPPLTFPLERITIGTPAPSPGDAIAVEQTVGFSFPVDYLTTSFGATVLETFSPSGNAVSPNIANTTSYLVQLPAGNFTATSGELLAPSTDRVDFSFRLSRDPSSCCALAPKITYKYFGLNGLLPAGAAQTSAITGGSVTTIRNSAARGFTSYSKAVDAAALSPAGPAMIGIHKTWQFDPPIPADGSFSANLTLNYSSTDLPDDPNFDESKLQIVSFDPSTGAFATYVTTLDLTNKAATAQVNSLSRYYSLAVLGPFSKSLLNVPFFQLANGFDTIISAVNTGATDAHLSFSGFGEVTIPAGKQLLSSMSSLGFGQSGWAQAPSDVNTVSAVEAIGNGRIFDVLPLNSGHAQTVVLTDIELNDTYDTEIHIVNPATDGRALTVTLYSPFGIAAGTYTGNLDAKSTLIHRVEELFPGVTNPFIGYLVISGDGDIAAAALLYSYSTLTAVDGHPVNASGAATLYGPQLGAAGEFTRMILVNAGPKNANLALNAYNANGSSAGAPVAMALGGGHQYVADLAQLFGFDPTSPIAGSFTVSSDQPSILGDLTFGDLSVQQRTRASVPLSSAPAATAILPYLPTTVNIQNPNSEAAVVTLAAFSSAGGAMGTANLTIPGNGFASSALTSAIPAASGLSGGYVTLSSTQPVVSFAVAAPGSNSDFGAFAAQPIDAALRGGGPGTGPLISPGGVVNAASFAAKVSRGSLATIFGTGLSASVAQASSFPLPLTLGGVSVTVGGISAPLYYVSPSQINLQIPYETPEGASVPVVVSASSPVGVAIADYAIGVFTVVHSDNSIVTPGNPAAAGETLVIYATGIGKLNSPPGTGAAAGSSPPATAVDMPNVVGSSRVDLQACKLEYSIVSPK